MERVVLSSEISADKRSVWEHSTSLEGINFELAPIMRIEAPPGCVDLASFLALMQGDGGASLSATVWFFGWFPQRGWRPELVELEEDHFVERSQVVGLASWQHRRSVTARPGGCVVRDELSLEPLVRPAAGVSAFMVRALFSHRHRRLAARFGRVQSAAP